MDERTKAVISACALLIVNVAAMWGVSIDEGTLVSGICAVADLATMIVAIWKNHNFTDAAAKAQAYLDELKEK